MNRVVEIKHLVTVTLRAEKGAPPQYLWGEMVKETNGRGARRGIIIRPTCSTKFIELMFGKNQEILYLPHERRDLHKEEKGWPPSMAFTMIDNGVILGNGSTASSEDILKDRIKFLEAKVKGFEKDRQELLDILTSEGTMRLTEHNLRQLEFTLKKLKGLSEEERKPTTEGQVVRQQ